MANVNNLTTSNSYSSSTSLYGTRNVLTGLASGMDTEAMIQNSVTGYQTKISDLQKEQTKVEWKQDAYRDLIDQMNSITKKYTSYTSKTNLSSNSFFTSAKSTLATGANAAAVSVTGKTSSDIQVNAIRQMATAARYTVSASALKMDMTSEPQGSAINWDQSISKGKLSGVMTLMLGNSEVDLTFTPSDKYTSLDELVAGINSKLEAQNADISAKLDGDKVTFSASGAAKERGDSVYIRYAGGSLKEMLNVETATSTADENRFNYTSFTVKGDASGLTETYGVADSLEGKSVNVTLDGVTKQITLGSGLTDTAKLVENLQSGINRAFGAGKITVGATDEGGLRFDVGERSGSLVSVSSSEVGDTLGLGESGVSNYFNTGKKLGALLGEDALRGMRIAVADENITSQVRHFDIDGNELKEENGEFYRVDEKGNFILKDNEKVAGTKVHTFNVDTDGNLVSNYINEPGRHYRVDEKGEYLHELKINGATIGGLTRNTTLESVMSSINASIDAGVNVAYSKLTGQFVFTARETGTGSSISFDNDLAKKLFYADNSPAGTNVKDLLGDFVSWNEGKANLAVVSADAGYQDLGEISDDMTVQDLMDKINNGGNPAFKNLIRYNEGTGSYELTDAGGGVMLTEYAEKISLLDTDSYNETSLAKLFGKLQGGGMTAGTDALVDVTVNGTRRTLERASNVIDMDGMSVTLKETFNESGSGEAISFKSSTESDKVVDAIKSFVDDVNKLMSDLHSAYTTQPLKKSSSSTKRDGYEPLSEEDKAGMSETAVKNYEEKAKTGLLFGDTDLSSLYSKLLNVIQKSGSERIDMESIGLKTTYSNGVTQIELDETQLRTALDNDIDKVKNIFTKTKDFGAKSDGLMATLKTTLNAYGSISLGSQGLLVRKAGTKLSSVSLINNTLQNQINNITKQIETWQSRLSDKVDYYTKQFTQLEKLMGTMNNQSSMLADLMGGY